MSNPVLSYAARAQLLSLGIPESKHNVEALRAMIPPFDGTHQMEDLSSLADIVIYLGRHQLLSVETSSWKTLPWGTHACLFYKSSTELTEPFKKFFREGLLQNEKCVWVLPKFYETTAALQLKADLLKEVQADENAFELMSHQYWYENSAGRFRAPHEVLMGWLNKIEDALQTGFKGLRVAGDAHFHPDDLKSFFKYEAEVHKSIGTLKIKALCAYCIPKFPASEIHQILDTHQSLFGDFAISGK